METLRTCYERGMNCISNCVPNISWGKMSQNSPTQNFSPQKNRNHRGCTWRQNSPPRFFHDIFVGWFSQHLSTSVSHFSILLAFCFPKKAAETRCFPKLFAPLRWPSAVSEARLLVGPTGESDKKLGPEEKPGLCLVMMSMVIFPTKWRANEQGEGWAPTRNVGWLLKHPFFFVLFRLKVHNQLVGDVKNQQLVGFTSYFHLTRDVSHFPSKSVGSLHGKFQMATFPPWLLEKE